jgi:hypothetical protein
MGRRGSTSEKETPMSKNLPNVPILLLQRMVTFETVEELQKVRIAALNNLQKNYF